MNVLDLDGKKYVKSSVIARELGYTSDYVGQLCRSGKVDAKLFGRTWYVEQDSISGHKSTRYRSTNAVAKRVLHTSIKEEETKPTSIPIRGAKNTVQKDEKEEHAFSFAAHALKSKYVTDDTELIPKLRKESNVQTRLRVDLADAEKIAIESKNEQYNFVTPTLPEIRFKGRLKVSAVEEVSELPVAAEEGGQKVVSEPIIKKEHKEKIHHFHPKEVDEFKYKKAVNKVISSKKPKKGESHIHVESIEDTLAKSGFVIPVHVPPSAPASKWVWISAVGSSLLLSIISVSILFMLSVRYTVTQDLSERSYFFDTKNIEKLVGYFKNEKSFFNVVP